MASGVQAQPCILKGCPGQLRSAWEAEDEFLFSHCDSCDKKVIFCRLCGSAFGAEGGRDRVAEHRTRKKHIAQMQLYAAARTEAGHYVGATSGASNHSCFCQSLVGALIHDRSASLSRHCRIPRRIARKPFRSMDPGFLPFQFGPLSSTDIVKQTLKHPFFCCDAAKVATIMADIPATLCHALATALAMCVQKGLKRLPQLAHAQNHGYCSAQELSGANDPCPGRAFRRVVFQDDGHGQVHFNQAYCTQLLGRHPSEVGKLIYEKQLRPTVSDIEVIFWLLVTVDWLLCKGDKYTPTFVFAMARENNEKPFFVRVSVVVHADEHDTAESVDFFYDLVDTDSFNESDPTFRRPFSRAVGDDRDAAQLLREYLDDFTTRIWDMTNRDCVLACLTAQVNRWTAAWEEENRTSTPDFPFFMPNMQPPATEASSSGSVRRPHPAPPQDTSASGLCGGRLQVATETEALAAMASDGSGAVLLATCSRCLERYFSCLTPGCGVILPGAPTHEEVRQKHEELRHFRHRDDDDDDDDNDDDGDSEVEIAGTVAAQSQALAQRQPQKRLRRDDDDDGVNAPSARAPRGAGGNTQAPFWTRTAHDALMAAPDPAWIASNPSRAVQHAAGWGACHWQDQSQDWAASSWTPHRADAAATWRPHGNPASGPVPSRPGPQRHTAILNASARAGRARGRIELERRDDALPVAERGSTEEGDEQWMAPPPPPSP